MPVPTPAPARPEPVLDAAKKAGAIGSCVGTIGAAVTALGATTGWTWATAAGAIVTTVGAALAGVLPYVLGQGARAQVTPLENPVAMDGTPLVEAVPPLSLAGDHSPSMGPDLPN